jgi:hypothetical protein
MDCGFQSLNERIGNLSRPEKGTANFRAADYREPPESVKPALILADLGLVSFYGRG